ncbi:MAG: PH domain-containing protein [Ilumatobacteraceae bacterium]
MAYPKKLLNDHEHVVADLHPHWWHFVQPAIVLALAIILGIFTLTREGTTQDVLGWITILLIIGSAIWLLARFISWISTNFVVTDQRVIFRTGVFAKQGIEIPLDRVNTVHFSQGVIERIVGAGDLMIESAGAEGQQRFTDIRSPDKVQRLIHAQMELRNDKRLGGGGGGGDDVASQLEKLEGMLERGTLTQEEFDAQKRKLLDG